MTTGLERTRRVSDRLLGLLGARLFLWLAIAFAVTPHLLKNPYAVTDHYDEHYFYAHDDAARISMAEYHELPAWNPYYCGGIPLAANPQDESLSPDFLLRLVYGTGPGRRLTVVLFLLLGMEGTYWVARKHGISTVGAATAAGVFAISGRFFFMLEFGWINMFGFELLPWTILGLENGARSWRWQIVGGFALGWMVLAGGTYSAPYTALALFFVALYDAVARLLRAPKDPGDGIAWWRSFASLAGVGLTGALFASAKILPMLRVIGQHPRTTHGAQSNDTFSILGALLTSHSQSPQGLSAEGYVGLLVAALALFVLFFRDRTGVRMMTLTGVFFALAMGDQGKLSLWGVIRRFPIYDQLRNPERFTIVLAFFLALALGRTLSYVEDLPEGVVHALVARVQGWRKRTISENLPRLARFVCAVVGFGIAAFLGFLCVHTLVMDDRMHEAGFFQSAPVAVLQDFHQARGNRWDAQVWAPANRGTLQCFEETEFEQSPLLRGDLEAEEFPLDAASGTVKRIFWSPSKIVLAVHATTNMTVVVNQNWAPLWSSSVGNVQSLEGELSVAVPPGDHELVLKYDDGWLDLGIALTLLAYAAALTLFVRWALPRVRAWSRDDATGEPAPTKA